MSKFYINTTSAKKDVINLRDEAVSLHAQHVLLKKVASANAFSGAAYSEIQEVLHTLSDMLSEEEKKVRLLAVSLAFIIREYEEAEEKALAHISHSGSRFPDKSNLRKLLDKPEPDYDYKKQVDDLLYKLQHPKEMSPDEYIELLYDLLKRASFLDPQNCTLTKAEKEALLRWIGPLADKLGKIGDGITGISEAVFRTELARYIFGSDTINGLEEWGIGVIAEPLAFLLGFAYNPETDSYYTKEGCIQQQWGFCDAIDDWGGALGMDLDTDVTTFTYDGQEFRIQLWKGNYGWGGAVGSEFGLYSRSEGEALAQPYEWQSEDSKYILYESADDPYQPAIKQTTYYETEDGTRKYFTCDTADYGDGDDYWNLNIRTDPGVDKDTIHVQYTIDCSEQGEGYAQAMYEALKNSPNLSGEPKIDGTTITFEY